MSGKIPDIALLAIVISLCALRITLSLKSITDVLIVIAEELRKRSVKTSEILEELRKK